MEEAYEQPGQEYFGYPDVYDEVIKLNKPPKLKKGHRGTEAPVPMSGLDGLAASNDPSQA